MLKLNSFSKKVTLTISTFIVAVVTGAPLMMAAGIAYAQDMSGHATLGTMDESDRYPFIAGIIEGIAYHRYYEHGKDSQAMNCVYDWFYDDASALDTIYASFGQFPDYPPAAVIAALANRKCGE